LPSSGISFDATPPIVSARNVCFERYSRVSIFQTAVRQACTGMKKLRFLVSLTTNDNDYQIEQAQSAEAAARKLGVELQVIYADNDAITQSTQLLKAIQAEESHRPNAIVLDRKSTRLNSSHVSISYAVFCLK